jgi:hypothetical protein
MGPIEGESDIPWKPPVIAAILGALAVGIYVIYAIVTGPSIEDDVVPDPPSGYVPVTGTVGARVERVTSTPTLTHIAVSTTANAAGDDPSDVFPFDIAYWDLRTPSGPVPMQGQYRWPALVGTGGELLSVTFPADTPTAEGELVAYAARSVVGAVREIELPSGLPQTVNDVRIDLGEGVIVVIESLTIDEYGGYVEWKVAEGTSARVDVIVRFVDADESPIDDTILVPDYAGRYLADLEAVGVSPLPYAFGSQYRLERFGDALDGEPSTMAMVEIRVEAVTSVANPVALPLDR